jgi:hypothetical protein
VAARGIWEDTAKDGSLGADDTPAVQRALLCLASLCQATFSDTGAVDALLDAGRFANVVAGLDANVDVEGGVLRRGARAAAPVALFVAQQLARVRERLPEGPERAGFDAQTAEMPFLMDVYKRRFAAVEGREGVRDMRVRRKPNAFECARDGCGIAASTPGALRRCAGKCPPEDKPYYCSSECQRMVRAPPTPRWAVRPVNMRPVSDAVIGLEIPQAVLQAARRRGSDSGCRARAARPEHAARGREDAPNTADERLGPVGPDDAALVVDDVSGVHAGRADGVGRADAQCEGNRRGLTDCRVVYLYRLCVFRPCNATVHVLYMSGLLRQRRPSVHIWKP